MIRPLTVRVSVLAMSIALATSAQATVTAVTDTVKGRPATVSNATISNQSAPGLNPAQGDVLEVTYDYSDPDGLPEDKNLSVYGWMADGSAAGEPLTGETTFVPGASQLEKFLTVQITAAESAPSDPDRATMVESAPTGAPVLPSRAEFESRYHLTNNVKRWGDAYMYCAGRGERLMSEAELQELFVTYTRATAVGGESNSDISRTYGYSLSNPVWAKEGAGSDGGDINHRYVYINTDGHLSSNNNSSNVPVGCAKFGGTEGLPTVSNVTISGTPTVGSTLTANYTYSGNSTIPDRSRFQWYRLDTPESTPVEITGANTENYQLSLADTGKTIQVKIIAASYDTVEGNEVSSNFPQTIQPAEVAFPPNTMLAATGHGFGINSGFPSVAFTTATFQIQIDGSASGNSNYNWSTEQSWVNVDSTGNVSFNGQPAGGEKAFKVKALSKDGIKLHSKTFTLSKWYLGFWNENSHNDAVAWCSTKGGIIPQMSILTNDTTSSSGSNAFRAPGTLWGEWGHASAYSSMTDYFWSDDDPVKMVDGDHSHASVPVRHLTCVKNL